MNKLVRILVCVAALAFAAQPAFALNDTIGVTAGSGKTANLISFASTHVISEAGLCDATVENQCGTLKVGNTALPGDIALVVSDPTLLAAVNASIPAGANLIGLVTPAPTAGQGCTPYHLSGGTAASNNSTSIKGSAVATACRFTLVSTSATLAFLKVYDSAAAPTCSSATNLKHVYPIPAGTTGSGLQVLDLMGEAYANGLGFCVTGGGTDTDNSNAPTGIYVEASYK